MPVQMSASRVFTPSRAFLTVGLLRLNLMLPTIRLFSAISRSMEIEFSCITLISCQNRLI